MDLYCAFNVVKVRWYDDKCEDDKYVHVWHRITEKHCAQSVSVKEPQKMEKEEENEDGDEYGEGGRSCGRMEKREKTEVVLATRLDEPRKSMRRSRERSVGHRLAAQ